MKKLISLLIALMLLMLFTPLYGQSTNITGRPTSYWFSGNPDKDNAWNWMKEANNSLFGNIGTGKTFYADSGVNIEGAGLTMDSAKDTLDEAINLCVANRGDRIYVAQGHREDGVVTTAAMWTADIDGIQIIGLGQGSLTATFAYNFTSNTCVVSGDNITIHNLRFRPSISAVTTGVNVTGSYVNINSCDFGYPEDTADEFADALYVGTSTGVIVENNYFNSGDQAGTAAVNFDAATNLIIRNNRMYGDCSDACIYNAITLSEYVLFEDNILWNGDTSALETEPVWEVMSTTVGLTKGNFAICNVSKMDDAFVGDLLFNAGNHYTEGQGQAYAAFNLDMVAASTTGEIVITPGRP